MPTTITLPSKFTQDENGNKFAPITTPNAVRFPDGTNLNDVLANLGTSDVMPIVIISTTPPTGSIGLIYFNPNTSKFYQYNWNDEYAEIETPHKAIGFSTASQQEHYFEIVDGVISQEAYDDWGGWYIDYTGAYLEIGQMMYFDNLATVYLPTRQQMYEWNGKQDSVAKLGSTTKPVYTSTAGTFAECSSYAGGTAVTLNGTSKAASTASFYAPTSAGTNGYVLKSNGSGAPTWMAVPTIPSVTLNGSSSSSPG